MTQVTEAALRVESKVDQLLLELAERDATIAALKTKIEELELGWQPIETAPTTGEQVDLWCRSPGIHGGGYARTADCWHSGGKWWRYDENGDDQCRTRVHNATHWIARPLPPPPVPDEGL